ncbi:unnamed protein product, partial [Amoebophrya sp. A25]
IAEFYDLVCQDCVYGVNWEAVTENANGVHSIFIPRITPSGPSLSMEDTLNAQKRVFGRSNPSREEGHAAGEQGVLLEAQEDEKRPVVVETDQAGQHIVEQQRKTGKRYRRISN